MSRKTLLLALVVAVLTACANQPSTVAEVRGAPAVSLEAAAAEAPAGPPPVAIIRTWDTQRARAWARGDPRRLRALYTPGSVAGRRDRAMLRAWVARGLLVRDLRTQLLAVRVLQHAPSAWTLLVTDRLAGGTAVGRGPGRPLPRDEATTRTVRLRWLGGRWRVASVLPGEVRP